LILKAVRFEPLSFFQQTTVSKNLFILLSRGNLSPVVEVLLIPDFLTNLTE